MTTVSYAHGDGPDHANAAAVAALTADRASRRWRTVWRVHFYAGLFAAPFLVLMALSGLVILYTQPIQDLTQGNLRQVRDQGEWASFDAQAEAVRAAYPEQVITSVVMPRHATSSTSFGLDDGREVFVDPYSAKVLGAATMGRGIVGLANRLHGTLNNESVTVPLVSISGLIGEGAVVQRYPVGDLLLEILGVWTLVLALSGIYLWLPRSSRTGAARPKARFIPRGGTKGRARWRDLHATGGIALSLLLVFFLTTGMPWSAYWGQTWSTVANKLTAGNPIDPPGSNVARLGDLDRLGNQINWNTGATVMPTSATPVEDHHGGETNVAPHTHEAADSLPAMVSLDTVIAAADQEGMLPGYSISYPENSADDAGNTSYGSFSLVNSWPRKTGEARTVFLDQWSAKTLASEAVYGGGAVSRATDTLVSTHMGTQLGIFSRIAMTLGCLLVLWSVFTALVMYWRRRRPGSLGLPKRPREIRLANQLLLIAVLIGLIYPLWGVSAIVVLTFDRFVIRKVPRLRTTFGQA